MKKIGFFLIFLVACLVLGSFGQAEAVFEHKLSHGWKYKSFAISKSGLKALYLLPDLPGEALLTTKFQPRLQVFDKDDQLLHDCLLEHGWWLGSFTRDDKIIICRGDETGCWTVKVVDPTGKVVSAADAGGRWPAAALLGKEIALVPGFLQYEKGKGTVSIIDEATGRENARFEEPRRDGEIIRMSCFLPMGEDGMYVVGIERTLFLRSHLHPGVDIWSIPDTGGDIRDGWVVNDELIEVRYERKDFDAREFMVGTAIIEWRTGKILFNKQGHRRDEVWDDWFVKLVAPVLIVDGDLVFSGYGETVRLPRCADPEKGWDEHRMRRCHLSPSQTDILRSDGKHARPEEHGNYIIKDFGDAVRVEMCMYIDDPVPEKK